MARQQAGRKRAAPDAIAEPPSKKQTTARQPVSRKRAAPHDVAAEPPNKKQITARQQVSKKQAASDAAPEPPSKKRATASTVSKTQPKATKTKVTKPKVTKPKVTKPEVTKPEVTKPKVTKSAGKAAAPQQIFQNAVPSKKMQIYVFGEGSAGELGLGSTNATDVTAPRLNPNLDGVVNIATGGMHGVALTEDNKVLTWGVNDLFALGRDTTWDGGMRDIAEGEDSDSEDDSDLNPREAMPTAIPADALPEGTEIVQVAAGDSATFMLTREGFVYGCGTFRDANGVWGFTLDPKTDKIVKTQKTLLLIPNLKNIQSLSVGADFALALDHEGNVFAWGSGQQNQLGRRLVERRRHKALIPERVELPKNRKFVSIHTGNDHAFAIDSNGDTWAWGLNNFAQTGIADVVDEDNNVVETPQQVPSLVGKNLHDIRGGRHHSIGVTRGGECLVWGRMDGGQLGLDNATLPIDDSTKVRMDERGRPRILLEPTALPIPKCVHATAGSDHCIAITSEGKAYSWGFNVNYQCGQGTSDDILVAKLMDRKKIADIKFCWAGAGGQYSMLASDQDSAEASQPNHTEPPK